MKKTIKDLDLNGKKVIIRVDFNVPIKEDKILDDNRIRESLETINFAIKNGAKVILMSHLGRIKTKADKNKNSLYIVSKRLSELLNREVIFIDTTRGKKLESAINSLKNGDVLLMENTRFEDLDGNKESINDIYLGKYWASLGDVFINDAFGTSHREHASNVGIASNLESGIGFLIEKEIKNISNVIDNPERPFTVILGGAKIKDKIGVLTNLVKTSDYILIGGAMAYTFLKSQGYNVGNSLVDDENIDFCKNILSRYSNKIVLPVDSVVSDKIENGNVKEVDISSIENNIGLDIGEKTIELFEKYLSISKSIVWNGTLGLSEYEEYANGTKTICDYLSKLDAKVIIGGGDTASAVINFGYKNSFTHISTGGGASLEMLEGKNLPGIEVIQDI